MKGKTIRRASMKPGLIRSPRLPAREMALFRLVQFVPTTLTSHQLFATHHSNQLQQSLDRPGAEVYSARPCHSRVAHKRVPRDVQAGGSPIENCIHANRLWPN